MAFCLRSGSRGAALGLRLATGSTFCAWRQRARKPLPFLYLILFTLAGLGGALYPPNNFDALTYRLPQVLHWLDAGRWHWIATANEHFNIMGVGYSWLMAPLLALTQSDRSFFLPNLIAFAFLPGLFFSVARSCGVRRRVAWYWMWILPAGYCYALQAGGIGSDLLPAVYILAAIALALKSRRSGSVRDAWFSLLAAALATGVKAVILPLGLPWLVAIAPSWRLLVKRPIGTTLVVLAGLAVSFLPTAALNIRNAGAWTGDPQNLTRLSISDPIYGLVGNVLQIAADNVAPPVWPSPESANTMFARFTESPTGEAIRDHYPRFGIWWFELVSEDGAGVGLGIVALVSVTIAALLATRSQPSRNVISSPGLTLCAAGVAAATVFGAKTGSEAAARLFAAYYPFVLLPILLWPGQERFTYRRWWQIAAFVCAASILPTLILNPARPLWPAQSVVEKLAGQYPENGLLQRARLVYAVFSQRHDHLAPLKKYIPTGVRTVGFVPTGNDLEGSLWQPFGTRRAVEVLTPERSDPAIQQLHGSVIISSPRGLMDRFGMTVEEFSTAVGGRLVGEEIITLKASVGPERWCAIAVE